MDCLKGFASARKLNNAQLKQLVEKIEADEDGTIGVCLGPFCRNGTGKLGRAYARTVTGLPDEKRKTVPADFQWGPFCFVTSVCTVLLLIPNFLAALRTVVLFSMMYWASAQARSSMFPFKKQHSLPRVA